MSAELMRSYLDILNEQQQIQLDEGIMDSIKSLVPKAMKALGGDAVAEIAQQVKQATGGDYTLSKENAVKVAKALGFEEILKNKIEKDPQGQVSEDWGLAGNWQGKLVQMIYTAFPGFTAVAALGFGPGGLLQWWLGTLGLFLLVFMDTFFSTDRGMVGSMGRYGNKGFETEKGPRPPRYL